MDFEDIIWVAIVLFVFTNVGKCTYKIITDESVDTPEITVEQGKPEGNVKKTPSPEPKTPEITVPKGNIDVSKTPEQTVVKQDDCEVIGNITFNCSNSVKLGNKWYTVKVECDRDPYDETLECKVQYEDNNR